MEDGRKGIQVNGRAKCFRAGFNAVEEGFMEGRRLYDMVRVRVVLGAFYYGSESDYKCGLNLRD